MASKIRDSGFRIRHSGFGGFGMRGAEFRVAMGVVAMLLLQGNWVGANSVREDSLAAHNRVRAGVGVPALEWSDELAAYALRYAEKQRDHQQCAMVHSRGPYGENLFWGSGKPFTVSDAVRSWANEAHDYDWESNSCAPGKVCGHYTQLVWADTKSVGCAVVACHDGATFVICSYDPPGNFVGERPFQRKAPTVANRDQNQDPNVANVANVGKRDEGEGRRGGEQFDAAEAQLCRCMLSCVSKSKSSQWRHESSTSK